MTRVLHLLDDTTLGGVVRFLAVLRASTGDAIRHEEVVLTGHGLSTPLPPADVVCLHFSSAWARVPFLVRLRAMTTARVLLVEHTYTRNFERLAVPSPARFRAMLRLSYRLAGEVVAVSEGQAAWIREVGLVAPDRLTVAHPASACGHLAALAPPKPHAGPLRLGFIGRLAHEKGVDLLLEAMRRLPPGTAVLSIAGSGPKEAALRQQAADVASVAFAGTVLDHAGWLASIDAVVAPSRWEAFGLVALEARMAARPVIVSGIDGLAEQLAAGGGVVFQPDSAAALV